MRVTTSRVASSPRVAVPDKHATGIQCMRPGPLRKHCARGRFTLRQGSMVPARLPSAPQLTGRGRGGLQEKGEGDSHATGGQSAATRHQGIETCTAAELSCSMHGCTRAALRSCRQRACNLHARALSSLHRPQTLARAPHSLQHFFNSTMMLSRLSWLRAPCTSKRVSGARRCERHGLPMEGGEGDDAQARGWPRLPPGPIHASHRCSPS